MPAGGSTKAAGMIQHRDAEVLAFHGPVVVAPCGGLAPGITIDDAVAVDDLAAELAIDRHAGWHANAEAGVLSIIKRHVAIADDLQ